MKLQLLLLCLFSIFSLAFAWSKDDYELFDLVGAVEAAEGKGTTFYSWLEVSPKATAADIGKAYRKKSMILHPDKNPDVKGIQERFARLGVVAAILRDGQRRERYDFFYKNGVPRWRGTGYYYSRYRPGLGSVAVFLAILTSSVQYIIQGYNYKKDVARIDRFIEKARIAAWGPKMIPLTTSKKVRVSLANSAAEDDGRAVEMLVDPEHVYLLGDDEPVLLDASMATKPSFTNTWLFNLVRGLVNKALSKSDPKSEVESEEDITSAEEDTDAAEGTDSGVPKVPAASKIPTASTAKVGGRRRTVPKKK